MPLGDYIAFLDSDDYVENNMYELLYEKAQEANYDMVECDFIWEYPNKFKIDTGEVYCTKKEALEKARVVAWNKLYKKEIIKSSNVQFPKGLRYEDVEFFYKILPNLNKIGFVKQPLVHYIQRENSISNTQNIRTKEIFTILDNVINFYKENGIYDEYKEELEYTYARYLLCSSFKRITKVQDKVMKKQLLKETWNNLNTNFPNWKKNKLIRKNSWKNRYMRSVNYFTFKIYGKIL